MKKWMQRLNQKTQSDKGVTLIELLAVIVIIAIIAAIAVPVVLGSIQKSKTNTTEQNMSVIVEALNRYAANNDGKFPTGTGAFVDATTALSALTKADTNNNNQPYIQALPQDAWGQDFYAYLPSDGSSFELETAEADKAANAKGDALYFSNKMTSATKSLASGATNGSW